MFLCVSHFWTKTRDSGSTGLDSLKRLTITFSSLGWPSSVSGNILRFWHGLKPRYGDSEGTSHFHRNPMAISRSLMPDCAPLCCDHAMNNAAHPQPLPTGTCRLEPSSLRCQPTTEVSIGAAGNHGATKHSGNGALLDPDPPVGNRLCSSRGPARA